jgi:xanthine dehydrogenase accessory factor
MGLEVVVNDPQVEARDYPAASRLITDDLDYSSLDPGADDYVVIATQHKGDHESMVRALDSGAGYIALIASRKRAALVMDFLQERGYGDDQLARVRAPAGIDLGARTPEEIALCVISEIVLERRQGSGRAMRSLRLADPETADPPRGGRRADSLE